MSAFCGASLAALAPNRPWWFWLEEQQQSIPHKTTTEGEPEKRESQSMKAAPVGRPTDPKDVGGLQTQLCSMQQGTNNLQKHPVPLTFL